ncbi:DUF1801 domain-containing protein [Candidatus Uabimicrobium amorphum]|uniref:YdhG-like domain-containing protein n=1 Tax=Uabimicrobium amorphum TaxID=2596890 RepID=A0A5S9IQY0_UABAM|nr:DUF1801 domain-containing protein [Candidatus Uabimicrobium amorphum]BBM85822.1 hypothetical protein UABAM_04200 [Candidatus Uabimicrobium amorphum]
MSKLLKKMQFNSSSEIYVINAPQDFDSHLQEFSQVTKVKKRASAGQKFAFVLVFVKSCAEIAKYASKAVEKLSDDAVLWFAYPKKSSKKYTSDISRDDSWQPLGDLGYEGVRMVAIDSDWSALRFRDPKYIKELARDKKRTISQSGKKRVEQRENKAVQKYLASLPKDRQEPVTKLRQAVIDNLPEGFAEIMGSVGLGYVVPHSLYPEGYHCDPKEPLPFMNIASRKGFVAFYHMGVYADKKLYEWFVKEYPKHCSRKLDMGKSCIRFKKMDEIPYALIGKLVKKISVKKWIAQYEKELKKSK